MLCFYKVLSQFQLLIKSGVKVFKCAMRQNVMKSKNFAFVLLAATLVFSCNSGPTEVNPVEKGGENGEDVLKNSSVFGDGEAGHNHDEATDNVHQVTVLEVLPTQKYVYLRVEELGTEYWIATLKTEVEVGGTYYFTGGLIKENFESKEHNRVFDELLLVNNFVAENHGAEHNSETTSDNDADYKIAKTQKVKGTTAIADIVKKPSDFAGKKVRIQGTCTKVNEGILKTNWVHINDGTNNGYDFTATTSASIKVGSTVVLEGTIVLNKDFGSGYSYDILLEDCVQIQ